MSERQIQGAGLVLLSLLAAILVTGVAWQLLIPVRSSSEIVTGSGRRGEVISETRERTRLVWIPAGWRVEQVAKALEKASVVGSANNPIL